MNDLKVAILMSAYNGEKYIRQQIDSILAQQGDFQLSLWVRDDGSTDSTRQILQALADEGKLCWYAGENLKPAKSFLDLVSHCPGYDYYGFADQDDIWYPDKVISGIRMLENETGPAMSFANAHLVDAEGETLGRNVYTHAPQRDYYSVVCGGGILGCTVMFNEKLAALLRTYNRPDKLIMHDSYAAILCTLFDGRILFDIAPHMDYRQHGNNVMGTQWTKWDALKERWGRISRPEPVSIADMAQSILAQDPQAPDPQKLQWLQKVAAYRDSLGSAVSLACSRKPHYNSRNMAITMRLAILLRNR